MKKRRKKKRKEPRLEFSSVITLQPVVVGCMYGFVEWRTEGQGEGQTAQLKLLGLAVLGVNEEEKGYYYGLIVLE